MDIDINHNKDALLKINHAFKMFSDPIDMMAYLIDLGKKSHNITQMKISKSGGERGDFRVCTGCKCKLL